MNETRIRKKRKSTLGGHWRIYVLVLFVFSVGMIILSRLYYLQVSAHDKFHSTAKDQHEGFQELISKRGEIYLEDENGHYPVAVNREYKMAYISPKDIEDEEKALYSLTSILGVEKDILQSKLSKKEDAFEVLKHKLSDDEISKIQELDLKGVHLINETFRYYPAKELASHIIGFVGSDGEKYRGRYGLEAYWEEELQGKSGKVSQERDAAGRWISIADRDFQPAENGVDLILTVDHTVQYEVEKILKDTVEKHKADNGSIIVMDPKTGKILAMANYPNFNPNEYSKVEDMSAYMNPIVSLPYESGSIFKTITMAAGIDDGKITPETTYVDTGVIYEAGYEIKNSDEKSYGEQTMTQVLEESLNTGSIYIQKQLGNKKFAEYVERFGFGEKTGVDLPGELPGNINNLKNLKRDIQFFTASFGQGITTTPIQVASAYSAIANGGKLMKPQIIDRMVYSDGKEEEIYPKEIRRVIGEDAAKQTSQMLRSVVVNGHGKRADVEGYLVGGKTGTAQVAKAGEKGYEDDINIGSFVGYAPTDDPMFTVLVKIYHPKNVIWAESSAAPAFGRVMKFLLEYYKVEPTEEVKSKNVLPLIESTQESNNNEDNSE